MRELLRVPNFFVLRAEPSLRGVRKHEPYGGTFFKSWPRIGRVTFSKSGKTLYYQGREFIGSTHALKANYFDCEAREYYWISGCKKRGGDRLYSGTIAT